MADHFKRTTYSSHRTYMVTSYSTLVHPIYAYYDMYTIHVCVPKSYRLYVCICVACCIEIESSNSMYRYVSPFSNTTVENRVPGICPSVAAIESRTPFQIASDLHRWGLAKCRLCPCSPHLNCIWPYAIGKLIAC